jgi:hypothetical protein
MRRVLTLTFAALLVPAAIHAQPRLMVGGGITAPNGDFSSMAETGTHLQVSLHVDIPTLPIAFRADGAFHRLDSSLPGQAQNRILNGSLSLVYILPSVSFQPYLLAGWGSYRVESGPVGMTAAVQDPGYHGGFGVSVGGLGFGAYAEIRYVQINAASTMRMIPFTLGLRL